MIVKTEFHTSFEQTAVLYTLFSVTTNVATLSTLNVKCQRFGMDTDLYIYIYIHTSVGNPDLVVFRSSGKPRVPSNSPLLQTPQLSNFEK